MKTPLRLLTLAFALTVAAAAHAQTVITSLPYNISTGGIYVLNSNLSSSQTSGNLITVSASNVTIDFQNHYISGPVDTTTTGPYGINASERSNVTVKNGTVAHCFVGINLTGNGQANTNAVGQLIDNMRVTRCSNTGIYLAQCPASRVTNCQVSETGFSTANNAYGILTYGVGAMAISNCIVSNVTAASGTDNYGIFVSASSFVRQCTVANAVRGISGGKYQDNLTYGTTTAFSGGTDAGGNN